MYNSWEVDMAKTQKYIETLRLKIFNGVEFRNIENSKNEILLWLDQYSGIDYIFKSKKENNIIGVAARIQFNHNWKTFTIRYSRHSGTKTEYSKRIEAIEKGYFYPTFTLQAYFDTNTDELLGAAIVETKKLYEFIENNPDKVHKRASDNLFIFVYWDDLINIGLKEFKQ